jgi:hypothetical protein
VVAVKSDKGHRLSPQVAYEQPMLVLRPCAEYRGIKGEYAVESQNALRPVYLEFMDQTTRKAIHHLLAIWGQYGNVIETEEGTVYQTDYMHAGEHAAEFLVSLGLGKSDGYALVLNDKGREIERSEE